MVTHMIQVIRLRQVMLSRVMKLQRAFRGHFVRNKTVPHMQHAHTRNTRMQSYREERRQERQRVTYAEQIAKVKVNGRVNFLRCRRKAFTLIV
jgi:hypothetical protein